MRLFRRKKVHRERTGIRKDKKWYVAAAGVLGLVGIALIPAAPAAAWGGPVNFGENWAWEAKPCSAYSTATASGGQYGANTTRIAGSGGQVRVSFRSVSQNNIGTVYHAGAAVTWMVAATGPHILGGYHVCHTGNTRNT